jgi:hypothetical protein
MAHGLTCCLLDPVANDPKQSLARALRCKVEKTHLDAFRGIARASNRAPTDVRPQGKPNVLAMQAGTNAGADNSFPRT